MEQAEQCVQHYREDHMGMKAHMRRNAYKPNEENPSFNAQVAENEGSLAWFDDVHNYGPI